MNRNASDIPSEILSAIQYDPDTGLFYSDDFSISHYDCVGATRRNFTLISGPDFQVAAHRLVFVIRGEDIRGKFVVHVNGDRHDNRLQNLLLLTGLEQQRYFFEKRRKESRKE